MLCCSNCKGHIFLLTDVSRSPCRRVARAKRAAHLPRALHCPGHGRARPDQPPAGPQVWRLPHLWSAVAGACIWCAGWWRRPVGWGTECRWSRCTEPHEACLVLPSCHLLFCWGLLYLVNCLLLVRLPRSARPAHAAAAERHVRAEAAAAGHGSHGHCGQPRQPQVGGGGRWQARQAAAAAQPWGQKQAVNAAKPWEPGQLRGCLRLQ